MKSLRVILVTRMEKGIVCMVVGESTHMYLTISICHPMLSCGFKLLDGLHCTMARPGVVPHTSLLWNELPDHTYIHSLKH